jgi:hypothetical protein
VQLARLRRRASLISLALDVDVRRAISGRTGVLARLGATLREEESVARFELAISTLSAARPAYLKPFCIPSFSASWDDLLLGFRLVFELLSTSGAHCTAQWSAG